MNKLLAIKIQKSLVGGFTLLEILVALAIFALISISCYRQVDANFRTFTRIEEKYLALWVAENKLEEIFVDRKWPLSGETRSETEILNSRWIVKLNISETDIKHLKKLEVSVYSGEGNGQDAILTLTRFVGEN